MEVLLVMDGLMCCLRPHPTNFQKLSSHSKSDISFHLFHVKNESVTISAAFSSSVALAQMRNELAQIELRCWFSCDA